MREYLNNVFKNKDAMKELWEANEEIFRELDGVRSWRDVRGKAENNELGDFLNKLIKE